MAKRLCKTDLLNEMAKERGELIPLLISLPLRRATKRGMNSLNWSCKDVVTHLFDWEGRTNDWYEAGLAGEQPAVPGDGFKWNQTRQLNEVIYKRHRRMSWQNALQQLKTVHERTQGNLKTATDEELTTINFYNWTGKSWTVSDYFRANTASHYKWARTRIAKWLKSADFQNPPVT